MTPERHRLVCEKLALRQPDLTVLLEQVKKPHNFSAILRSCDAVGVYRAHAIAPPEGLPLTNYTAQSADKWVRVRQFEDMAGARARLKRAGFRLLAAHPGADSTDFRQADLCQPVAIVLGTEKEGVSAETKAQVDELICVPMQGMVESLNVSVACALILVEAQRQRLAAGMYRRQRLPQADYDLSRFEWLHPKLAKYCQKNHLDYPELDGDGSIVGTIRGMVNDPWTA